MANYSYSLEHAYSQREELLKNGLPNILEIDNGHRRAYTFSSVDNSFVIVDNMGNFMSKKEMKELVDYLNYSIDNFNEEQIIDEKIEILSNEIEEYLKPKEKIKVQDKSKSGFVYLLEGENGKYKIGCSINPERRCKELCLSSCEKHKLIHTIASDDMYGLEKMCHTIFKDKRSHSEWFKLSDIDILLFKEDM